MQDFQIKSTPRSFKSLNGNNSNILFFTEKNVDEELEKNNLKIPPFPKYIGKSKSPNYFYNQWVA